MLKEHPLRIGALAYLGQQCSCLENLVFGGEWRARGIIGCLIGSAHDES